VKMLHFTNHAKDRMKERGISREQVDECLNNYQTSYPNANDNMVYIYNLPDGTRVKVVVREKSRDQRVVITVAD